MTPLVIHIFALPLGFLKVGEHWQNREEFTAKPPRGKGQRIGTSICACRKESF